jgi:hypothetical protein
MNRLNNLSYMKQLWMTRTALELVGQAGLGHTFDPLMDDEVPHYITAVKQLQ